MNTETDKKANLIQNVIDELNTSNLLQKFLQPIITATKNAIYPYYATHIIIQLVIIVLLLTIIYMLWKR
jgi:hypothetical protein